MDPIHHTQTPATTGTSVVGIKYQDGVIIAADMLGSYGSMMRFKGIERLHKINKDIVIGYSGDMSDFQFMLDNIREKVHEDSLRDDGFHLTPKGLHTYLTRVLYNCRSKLDPLWNSYLVAGWQDDKPYLGYVDMKGVAFEDKSASTGFGKFLAVPQLRELVENTEQLSELDAKKALIEALTVLYYRDCRAFNTYRLATVSKDGVRIDAPETLQCNWDVAAYVVGYE